MAYVDLCDQIGLHPEERGLQVWCLVDLFVRL